jgi:hypothetical protein
MQHRRTVKGLSLLAEDINLRQQMVGSRVTELVFQMLYSNSLVTYPSLS